MTLPTPDIAIEAKRGDTNQYVVTVTRLGAAVNLTGASVWMTLKRQRIDTDLQAIAQATIVNGKVVLTNAIGGIATVTFAPADTASLAATTTLFYDVQVKEASGVVTTVTAGTILITDDITMSIV